MPGILGGMIAWVTDGKFHPGYFLLVMLGLLLNHMALNMTDDYYDFRHLVDVFAADGKNPYTGGSGTLSGGLIEPSKMRNVFILFYIIAIGIGIFLGLARGVFTLFLLAVGFFCAFFYTAPPIKFGYRGFGEIAQLLCFGPGIGLGAYYIQAQRISWEAFWSSDSMSMLAGFIWMTLSPVSTGYWPASGSGGAVIGGPGSSWRDCSTMMGSCGTDIGARIPTIPTTGASVSPWSISCPLYIYTALFLAGTLRLGPYSSLAMILAT